MPRSSMRFYKQALKLISTIGFLIIMLVLLQRYIAVTQKKAPSIKLTPVRECTNGVCYNYTSTSRDQEYADYFIPRKKKVNPYKYDFILSPENICDSNTFLLILVPSHHSHMEERKAIRQTWGSVSRTGAWPRHQIKHQVKMLFLFGVDPSGKFDKIIKLENRLYGDVVQGNFIDSYKNLTNKILLGIKWTLNHCSESQYILKADDDTFVNIPKLLDVLSDVSHPLYRGVIIGNINEDAKVCRQGKWAVPEKNYPFPHFPEYAAGNTYVVSSNMASSLYTTSEHMPYIPVEDAFITGILAKVLQAEHVSMPGFTFWMDVPPTTCEFILDQRISATKVSYKLMFHIWEKLYAHDITC